MKIFKCDTATSKEYSWGELSEFTGDEIDLIVATGAEAAFYWYVAGSYEGSGQLLILKDGKWYIHDCGHCSCYGPTSDIYLTESLSDTLIGLKDKFTEEAWKDIEPLVCLAQENGYK